MAPGYDAFVCTDRCKRVEIANNLLDVRQSSDVGWDGPSHAGSAPGNHCAIVAQTGERGSGTVQMTKVVILRELRGNFTPIRYGAPCRDLAVGFNPRKSNRIGDDLYKVRQR